MCRGRAYRCYNAFAHTRQDGVFSGASYQLLDVCPHCYPGFGNELNAVCGYCSNGGGVDDFGVNGDLNCFEDVAASQVNGSGLLKGQLDIRLVRGDEGFDHGGHMTTG